MKKIIQLLLVMSFITIMLTGCMNGDNNSSSKPNSNGDTNKVEDATKPESSEGKLDEYAVNINSCRLAKDYQGKDIVIVKYKFTNNSDVSTSFTFAFDDKAFQNGVGLNKCYTAEESAKYSSDNQTKEVKNGASIDVEVAFYLNDLQTPVEVECSKLISFSDEKVTKTFNIK